ncbi:nitroreductase family protein [Eoetvoesiella caeni]|uniref:Putative NAD(P)H nitroreductase n=1 Tax=Eoetvoesiella caeni TaxID=645616 RepID=A0A366HKV1_9BURK|nr:nitroreductase [Eoetvoesiella caeni]MCI2807526.1 nitroreductase [Eoetvoesiella caeni]NYT53079.1 nitroreductase [Eoetvoesiella caeni]RBP43056.1 nitroreductase [Eoetvoesiella caeni]
MSVTPIEYLLSRRSVKFVQAPAPTETELSQILQAAMSAPDHGKLQPWRFALIRGDAVARLADLAMEATKRAGRPLTAEKEASTRAWLAKVPLLIALACRIDHSNTKVPEHERLLAVGAAVTNMLNAAHMLGYGAYWSTGLGTYVDEVNEALGFDGLDYRFLGYLAVGTPIQPPAAVERPDYRKFVSEWTGAATQLS